MHGTAGGNWSGGSNVGRSGLAGWAWGLALGVAACVLAGLASAAEPLRFCVTADNRGKGEFADILQQIKRLPGGPGAFMISNGDISPPDKTRGQIAEAFGESLPWYPVIGNHEAREKDNKHRDETMRYLRDYFDQHLRAKVTPGPAGTERTTYSFDAGPVHVAVINQYWDGNSAPGSDAKLDGDIVQPLREWLARDLKASGKPWKLVFGHEPAFPRSDEGWLTARHTTSSLNKYRANRDAFWKVLEGGQAAAFICGHTHRYSRYQPKGSTVWQIDAAQAGGSSSWKHDAFLIVTAEADRLKIEAYRSPEKKHQFALSDTLVLRKPARP